MRRLNQLILSTAVLVLALHFSDIAIGGNLKMVSPTGSVITELTLDLENLFEGNHYRKKFQLDYIFDAGSKEAIIALEPPVCQIAGKPIKRFDVSIDGKNMIAVGNLMSSSFSIGVSMDIPDEIEGEISCGFSELRDITTGHIIASINFRGFVHKLPRWVSLAGERVRDIRFSFDGLVARDIANTDVTSRSVYIRLINAKTYPAVARYLSPKGCTIGDFPVADGMIRLRSNGTEIDDGSMMTLPSQQILRLELNIASAVGIGNKSGVVRCITTGSLLYSY
jgi:hypothetical protein